MSQATINVVANMLGQTIPVQLAVQNDGAGQWTPTIPAGKISTAWTKNSDTSGVATLAAGHGFVTGDKVDVFWAGATGNRRYNMAATVSGNNITLSGGGGANLPVSGTAVILSKRQVVNAGFDPDDMTVLLVTTTRRASVVFADSGGVALLALDLAAGDCCLWWVNSGIIRPMTGNPVAAIWVSNGDSDAATDLAISVMYDSTP